MPIKGLTDRHATFPEIGAIRKGDRGGKNGAPRDLQWFRVEVDEREKEAAILLMKLYGEKPTELNVLFPFDDVDRNFESWYEAYTAGALIYRSDGERVLYWLDHATGTRKVVGGEPFTPHAENPLGFYVDGKGQKQPIKYKPVGRMKVMLPELGRLCYLTVHTTSLHDVINLTAQLRALHAIHGRLAGVPLKLRRRPVKISMPGDDGKRVRRIKWLLSIEADPEWVQRKLAEMKRLALPGVENFPQLAAPLTLPVQTGEPMTGEVMHDDDDESGYIEEGESENDDEYKLACEVTASDGTKYGERSDDDLVFVANSTNAPDDKKKAAAIILKYRAEHK